ncbi:hypothetical protein GCM10010149_88050 [Nonomuraea roseoviolacea subsp. roseoviolacea]|uniref:hypothetical protein n=1 Tax=Nonomuraea roseoviolacea TaxID=103837 RepID=UPI0031D3441D
MIDDDYSDPPEPEAWSEYHIHGNDDSATMYWSTNDDGDTGYPGEQASDTYEFQRRGDKTALQQAVRQAGGGSRRGILHTVRVYINGTEYTGDKDYRPS